MNFTVFCTPDAENQNVHPAIHRISQPFFKSGASMAVGRPSAARRASIAR